jgi:HTH-type transcriptional regulator/antitoxin HipB
MDYPVKTPLQLRPLLVGFRKAAGLTQSEIASRLGVTQQTYAQLEAKPEAASMDRLFQVLKMLKVNIILAQPSLPVMVPKGLRESVGMVDSPGAAKETAPKPRRIGVAGKTATGPRMTGKPVAQDKPEISRKPAARRAAPLTGTKKREDW